MPSSMSSTQTPSLPSTIPYAAIRRGGRVATTRFSSVVGRRTTLSEDETLSPPKNNKYQFIRYASVYQLDAWWRLNLHNPESLQ